MSCLCEQHITRYISVFESLKNLAKMNAKAVLITGTSRGIGLEFVQQLVKSATPPQFLFATCRDPDKAVELRSLAEKHPNVKVLKLDVNDNSAVQQLVKVIEQQIGDQGLNMLINNAGAMNSVTLDTVTEQTMLDLFRTNSVSPLMISKAFLPLLKKAASQSAEQCLSCNRAAIVNITSLMGSIADNEVGGAYAYRASKVALNMISKSLSVDLKEDGILVTALHPGWVQTNMGGERAKITTETSVTGLLGVMAGLTAEKTGSFLNYNGKEHPW